MLRTASSCGLLYLLESRLVLLILLNRYDRDFLLQFMSICKEKPDMLPPLDSIGLEPSYPCHTMSRCEIWHRSLFAMASSNPLKRPLVQA
jgi:Eukaryotic translation initiation factor 4G1